MHTYQDAVLRSRNNKLMEYSPANPTREYTVRLKKEPSPLNRAATRSHWNKPTSSQLMAPMITRIRANRSMHNSTPFCTCIFSMSSFMLDNQKGEKHQSHVVISYLGGAQLPDRRSVEISETIRRRYSCTGEL
jgi:hypothetical protein